MQDLRYALRTLGRTPIFTVVAVLTLGLGIGATSAIFSVVHGVILKPLPYRDPDRLANIWVDLGVGNQSLPAVSPLDFLDYRHRSTTFESFSAATGPQVINSTGALSGAGPGDTERVDVIPITANFFQLLGVDPYLGRHFTTDEETPSGEQVAILAYDLWARRYGGDRNIVGRLIKLDGADHMVVGVMPRGFNLLLPAEAFLVTNAQVWKPLRYDYRRTPPRNFTSFTVLGRLKQGVTLEQAQAEMDEIGRQLRAEHAIHESSDMRIRVVPMHQDIVKHAERSLFALLGAVAFVLLIVCANVAHLLLARATGRQHEMALRAALGARRLRLVRQLATESLVLAASGAVVGLLLASMGLTVLKAINPGELPRMAEIVIDGTVLLFTIGVSALTAVLFGLMPALRTSRQDLNQTLRASASLSPTRRQLRLRSALVIGEIALALVLLIGAGLMMQSFVRLQQVRPGFDHARVLTFRLGVPRGNLDARRSFVVDVERRLREIPGVTHVGFTSQLPLTGSGALQPYAYDETTARNWESATADQRVVSPEYFEAMGTRLVEGRMFDMHDPPQGRIVIDETLAARAWPGESAVGKMLQLSPNGSHGDLYAEVIGVVQHVRVLDLTRAVRPQIWRPLLTSVPRTFYVAVRTNGDPASLASPVRVTIGAADPDVAVDRVVPMSAYVAGGLGQARLSLALMVVFGTVALVLAVVGVYGVISYSVGQRTREIGIRMALGERPGRVRNTILLEGLRLIVPSLAIGAFGAWILTHFVADLLYQTPAADPVTFALTSGILLSVALIGCYVPARRATAVSPLVALRAE